jgi:hypothetical protein
MKSPLFTAVTLIAASVASAESPSTCPDRANGKALVDRCFGGDLKRGRYVGDTVCWPFAKTQRMEGVWQVELESSTFIPKQDGGSSTPRVVWLEVRRPAAYAAASLQGDTSRAFAVTLLGRRSLCPGIFGHAGVWSDEILVDRFISVRKIDRNGS